MTHQEYIRSSRPLWVSGVLLALGLLIPILVLAFEGWHSGVPYGVLFAVELGIFLPGILLLRRRICITWLVLSLLTTIPCGITIYHCLTATPDWMDTEIPPAVWVVVTGTIWANRSSWYVLGAWGWFRYFRNRNKPRRAEGVA
jgi:hypothetical protein